MVRLNGCFRPRKNAFPAGKQNRQNMMPVSQTGANGANGMDEE